MLIAAFCDLPMDEATIEAYPIPTKTAIPSIIDKLTLIVINGTGPIRRKAMAIDKFPKMDKIVGYRAISLI